MSTLKGAVVSPFVVLVAAVVAFAGWVATYTTPPPAAVAHAATPRRYLPQPPTADPNSMEGRLGNLQPGTPRLAVEQQLQAVLSPEVDPIDVTRGKPVLRSRCRITLDRPVTSAALGSGEYAPGAYVLTVEFDGATPGHPLTRAALAPAAAR